MKISARFNNYLKSCVQRVARWADLPSGVGSGLDYNRDTSSWMRGAGEAQAMRLSTVWACVGLLADTISSLPCVLYENTPTGRRPATSHPVFRLLNGRPNLDMTTPTWLWACAANLLLSGYSYTHAMRNGAGQPAAVYPLPSSRTCRVKRPDGRYEYQYTDKNGKTHRYAESDVMRVIQYAMDGDCALSPIQYGAAMLDGAYYANTAALKTFENGLMPTVAFSFEQVLKKDQRDAAREAIEAISGAIMAGRPAILEGGMKAQEIGINPADAQLLESRSFSDEVICSFFRVQPFMIGRASKGITQWGSGIEHQTIGFINYTMLPLIRRFEESMRKSLLTEAEYDRYTVEFSLQGLLRGDSNARSSFYASALQNGWMNRDEVRAVENMSPIPGGETYTVQSNLIPLERLGDAPDPAQNAQDAFKLWLLDGDRRSPESKP